MAEGKRLAAGGAAPPAPSTHECGAALARLTSRTSSPPEGAGPRAPRTRSQAAARMFARPRHRDAYCAPPCLRAHEWGYRCDLKGLTSTRAARLKLAGAARPRALARALAAALRAAADPTKSTTSAVRTLKDPRSTMAVWNCKLPSGRDCADEVPDLQRMPLLIKQHQAEDTHFRRAAATAHSCDQSCQGISYTVEKIARPRPRTAPSLPTPPPAPKRTPLGRRCEQRQRGRRHDAEPTMRRA